MVANVEETKRFSPSDAAALVHFEDDLARLVRGVVPAFDWIAPDPAMRTGRDLREAARWGRLAFRQRRMLADLAFLFSTSATQYLSEYFSSPYVLAALGWHAINDSVAGPSTPGTAFVLLHDHASEAADGGVRQWGFVRGGMGRVTELMARGCAGGRLRDPHERRGRADRDPRRRRDRRAAHDRRGDRGPPGRVQRRPETDLPPASPTPRIYRRSSSRGSRRTAAWARA